MIYLLLVFILFTINQTKSAAPACAYEGRGLLSSTCTNANAAYFRKTNYRFDNLDETVRCINCSLQIIESNTFDISGNQIKYLILENAQITVLKPKSFIGLVFLRKLVMRNNDIVAIPPETFAGVSKIEDLDLEHNSITSLRQNGFRELTHLQKLNLNYNRIKTIEDGSFNGLSALEQLHLSYNDIVNIATIFIGLENIAFINLEGNKITDITSSDIRPMDMLLQLNLAGNSMKTINTATFLPLTRLETLNLSSNPIEKLELGGFRGLDSLEVLDLSYCIIENIPLGLLSALHQLRILDLAFNRLTLFQTGVFSGLPELRKLNISHNRLTTYEKTGIFPLHSLHILDLSYNNLTDLDYKLLVNHLPSLSHIGLRSNPWPCYLKKEMEEMFMHDSLVFDLEPIDPKIGCNDSRPSISVASEQVSIGMSQTVYTEKSNGHEYALYVFMVLCFLSIAALFYMQRRSRREINMLVGRTNISEAHLISNSIEGNY